MKIARTVWGGGKAGDNFKGLPIAIIILYFGSVDEYGANLLRDKLKLPVLSLADFKANTNLKNNVEKIYMVGGNEKPVADTVLISQSSRYDTAQAVINYIKNLK